MANSSLLMTMDEQLQKLCTTTVYLSERQNQLESSMDLQQQTLEEILQQLGSLNARLESSPSSPPTTPTISSPPQSLQKHMSSIDARLRSHMLSLKNTILVSKEKIGEAYFNSEESTECYEIDASMDSEVSHIMDMNLDLQLKESLAKLELEPRPICVIFLRGYVMSMELSDVWKVFDKGKGQSLIRDLQVVLNKAATSEATDTLLRFARISPISFDSKFENKKRNFEQLDDNETLKWSCVISTNRNGGLSDECGPDNLNSINSSLYVAKSVPVMIEECKQSVCENVCENHALDMGNEGNGGNIKIGGLVVISNLEVVDMAQSDESITYSMDHCYEHDVTAYVSLVEKLCLRSTSLVHSGLVEGIIEHIFLRFSSPIIREQPLQKLEERNQNLEDEIAKIRHVFNASEKRFLQTSDAFPELPRLDPQGIRVHNNSTLEYIGVCMVDYDYSLSHYFANLQSLTYDLTEDYWVHELIGSEINHLYDTQNFGRDQAKELAGAMVFVGVSNICLIVVIVQYFVDTNLQFADSCVSPDMNQAIQHVHRSGLTHRQLLSDPQELLVHNAHLRGFLRMVRGIGKKHFLFLNYSFYFVDSKMHFMFDGSFGHKESLIGLLEVMIPHPPPKPPPPHAYSVISAFSGKSWIHQA